jgi:dTDP-4-amino-4,6-dideoxygalactose transaminase
MLRKSSAADLALFGAERLFSTPKSTSNLVQPEFERFIEYARTWFAPASQDSQSAVTLLEARLARFHETRHCVTFCSGFWALAITMVALARPGRREVVMPSLTYRRMADVVAWTGLLPRFAEVDPDTLAISGATAAECVGEDTALLLGVHPIVNCCDVQQLVELAEERHIPLLFDAVESVYERSGAGKIGTFGMAECFSLHASKLLNGFEGGYVTTNDSALAATLTARRDGHGSCRGVLDAKLNELHAAMALAGLDELDAQVARNRARYERYRFRLEHLSGIRLLSFDESQPTSYKNIVVELLSDWPLPRDLTIELLNADNVLARAYYSPPLHSKPMAYPHVPAELPLTDRLAECFLLLPCGDFVTLEDIDAVVGLLEFIKTHAAQISGRSSSRGAKV